MGQSPNDDVDDDVREDDDIDDTDDNDGEHEYNGAARKDPRIKQLSDENARHRNEKKNLQSALAAAQAELKKFEDANKTETQRVADELESVKSERDLFRQKNMDLQVENAFLSNSQYKWRNPKTALKLLDREKVTINDDGEFEGLDDAIKALAEAEPYLLDKNAGDEDDDDRTPPPSGQPTRRQRQQGTDTEMMVNKFPALRR